MGHQPLIVLLIAAPTMHAGIRHVLTGTTPQPYRMTATGGGSEGLRRWHEDPPDCVLLDERLPDMPALEVLAALVQTTGGNAPVVLLIDGADAAAALDALQRGAQDCLDRDHLTAFEVQRAIANTVEKVRLRRVQQQCEAALREQQNISALVAQAQETLRLSDERFRVALQGSPVVVFNQDRDLRYTWIYNPALGYTPDEVAGATDYDLFERHEDAEAIVALKHQVLTGGQGRRDEVWVWSQGAQLCYDLTVEPLHDAAGQVVGVTCAAMDISAHKQREQAIRRANERLSLALERLDGLLYEVDLRTGQTEWLEGITRLLGYVPAMVPPLHTWWIAQIHPDDTHACTKIVMDALASNAADYSLEYRVRHHDGHYLAVWDRARIERDTDGQAVRLIGTTINVTESKRTEEALQAHMARLRLALDAAHAGSWEWDLQTNENHWSDELWPLYGLAPHSCKPSYEAWQQTIHPADRASAERAVQEAARTGAELNAEWRVKTTDGAERWLMSRGMPARSATGAVVRYDGIVIDITARKYAEEALRTSEAKYRAVFNALVEGIVFLNPQGDVEEVNDAVFRLHGHTLQELTDPQTDPREHIIRSDGSPFPVDEQPAIVALRTGQAARDIEMGVPTADGGLRWRLVNAHPVYDDQGTLLGAVASLFDITARRQAEIALRQSEEKFARAFTSSPAALLITRLSDGRYIELNDAYSAIVGYARDELIGHLATEFNIYIDTGDRQAIVDRLLTSGSIRNFETSIRHRSGEIRHVIANQEVITLNDEICILSHLLDITERKQLEEALHTASQRFQIILASLYSGILVLRDDNRVEFANQAFCELFDFPEGPDAILGWHASDILARIASIYADPATALARIQEIRANGQPVRDEEVAISGGRTYLRDFIPIEIDGHTSGRVWHHVDSTDRKAAEVALRGAMEREQELRHAAETSSRLKDEFLATVSHELRTPLTAFLGYAQILQQRTRDEAYVARTVAKMVQSAKAQAQLIEDLLDVSRIAGGRLRIEPAPLKLIPVVQAALDTVRPTLAAKGLQLQLALDPAANQVLGDANRLQQVVWNLLANAAKFTPDGGMIRVGLAYEARVARLTVSDTGQGIHPDFLPFVFERFRQEDSSSKRAYGGLGLGLAIVRHLIELHGGSVAATSQGSGQGATFTIHLPLIPPPDPTVPADLSREESQPLAGVPPALHGRRVLVVDDQPAILDVLEEILVASGAVVRRCTTAHEALEAVRDWKPDVLVSDIAMPDEDGYWLIEHVRALPPEAGGATPAVALTAYVRMEDRLQVLGAGFQLYVPKPIEPGELQDVVARLIQRDERSA